jgi:hypothetical protein
MAELTGRERDLVQATFIGSYNALHGTSYVLSSRPLTEPTDLLFEGGGMPGAVLKVHHTRASGPNELRESAEVANFIVRPLREHLGAIGCRGFTVSIDVDRFPTKRSDRTDLLNRLWVIVHGVLGPVPSEPAYRRLHLNREDCKQYEAIAPFIRDLEVYRVEGDQPAAVVWSRGGGFIFDVAGQVGPAAQAKSARYGTSASDHVLLVQCETLPYDDDDLVAVREIVGASGPSFQEVWLVSLWGKPRADRVWP